MNKYFKEFKYEFIESVIGLILVILSNFLFNFTWEQSALIGIITLSTVAITLRIQLLIGRQTQELTEALERRVTKVIFRASREENYIEAKRLIERAPPGTIIRMTGISPRPTYLPPEVDEFREARIRRAHRDDCHMRRVFAVYNEEDWENLQKHIRALYNPVTRSYPKKYELRLLWPERQDPEKKYLFDMLIVGDLTALLELPAGIRPEIEYGAFQFMDPEIVRALQSFLIRYGMMQPLSLL
jgi:hypothetical protein